MQVISVTVEGKTKGKGRPRFSRAGGFVRVYTDPKDRDEESRIASVILRNQTPGFSPVEGPVTLMARFVLPIPCKLTKAERLAKADGPATCKPDLDNLVKLLMDAMNGVVYVDDKQVTTVVASKRYGTKPRIEITVEEE